jgi:plasmid replication initiation protein
MQYKYAMFKKRIILNSQYELEKYTDIFFDFCEIKEGRKVVSIKFTIYNQKQEKSNKLLLKDEKITKAKIKKEHDFYKQEDDKLNQSLQIDLNKKELVSKWINNNKTKYKKLLEEK